MMPHYELRVLRPRFPETPKGSRTWEWHLPNERQITVYRRLAGEEAGSHFHKGEDPSKNPEKFMLISGEIEFEFIDKFGNPYKIRFSAKDAPVELTIWPFVLHRATPITDCVFIEYRTTKFDPERPDTFPPSDFPAKTDWQESSPSFKNTSR